MRGAMGAESVQCMRMQSLHAKNSHAYRISNGNHWELPKTTPNFAHKAAMRDRDPHDTKGFDFP